MISTEKVYDMLPMAVDIYDKLDFDNYIKKIREENKNKKEVNATSLGVEVFKYVFKNSGKVKEEIFNVVAIFEEKTVDEIKAQNFMLTVNTLKEIFSDKDATNFLKQAVE